MQKQKINLDHILLLPNEGWLKKSGLNGKGLKKRYFRLKNDRILYYYKTDNSKDQPCGTIDLGEALSVEIHPKLVIKIHTIYRVYHLETENVKEQFMWLETLNRAIASGKALKTKDPTIIKEGFLKKQGGTIKNWKKRWFILTDTNFFYYKNQKSEIPKGEISLKDVKITILNEKKLNFSIDATNRRTFYIRCFKKEEMNDWIEQINNVITQSKETFDRRFHLKYSEEQVIIFREFINFNLSDLTNCIDKWEEETNNFDSFNKKLLLLTEIQTDTSLLLFTALDYKKIGVTQNDLVIAMTALTDNTAKEKVQFLFSYLSKENDHSLSFLELKHIFILWSKLLGCYDLKFLALIHKFIKYLKLEDVKQLDKIRIKPETYIEVMESEIQLLEIFHIWNLKF
ncbi:sesquipedalian [Anaeramoeba flamelloides]|uniref:Sesquipedalian n=1 Tax=Anaeramoeba flamelloides TaxID=1746091 RepID=A0AAV7Z575_9EUKA|nr:sesquipedalian [Anaeramoeba flamelloides]